MHCLSSLIQRADFGILFFYLSAILLCPGSGPFSSLRAPLERLQILSRPLDGSNAEGGAASVSNDKGGLWLSLVERFVRDEEVVGSNPASPTPLIKC